MFGLEEGRVGESIPPGSERMPLGSRPGSPPPLPGCRTWNRGLGVQEDRPLLDIGKCIPMGWGGGRLPESGSNGPAWGWGSPSWMSSGRLLPTACPHCPRLGRGLH